MTEILWCNLPIKLNEIEKQCGLSPNHVTGMGCAKHSMLLPYRPYVVGMRPTRNDQDLLARLQGPGFRNIVDISLAYGGDDTQALAAISAKLSGYGAAMTGAAADLYKGRMDGFIGSVKQYQAALLDWRDALTSDKADRGFARQNAHHAYQNLQTNFHRELRITKAQLGARGKVLRNFNRAGKLVRRNRITASLDIADPVEATSLMRFGRYARHLGEGVTAIDFGSRTGNVYNTYQSGGSWERELFVESLSFAGSAGVGYGAGIVGDAALGLLIAATPVGWIGLVVIGVGALVATGVTAATSIAVDHYFENRGGHWYDGIIKWIESI